MLHKKDGGKWLVDAQPGGRGGKRFRKTFKTQAEAKAYEAWLTTQVNQNSKWQPEKRDTRKLSELIEIWYSHHGSGLKAGANTHNRLKLDFTRFRRHISTSSSKLLKCQRAQLV